MLIITILTTIGVVCCAIVLIGGWWSDPFAKTAEATGRTSRTCKRCGHQYHSVMECPNCHALQTTTLTVERAIRHKANFDPMVYDEIVSVCRVPEDAGDIMTVLEKESYLILSANVDGVNIMVMGKVVRAEKLGDLVYITHKMPHTDQVGLPSAVARKAQEKVGAKIIIPIAVDGVRATL